MRPGAPTLEPRGTRLACPRGYHAALRDQVALVRARYGIGEQQVTLLEPDPSPWACTVAQHDLDTGPWPSSLARGRTLVRVPEARGRLHRPAPIRVPEGVFVAIASHLGPSLEPSAVLAIRDPAQAKGLRLVQLAPDQPWFSSGGRRIIAAAVGLELDASLRLAHVVFAARVDSGPVTMGWSRCPKTRSGVYAAADAPASAATPRHPVRRGPPQKTIVMAEVPKSPTMPFRRREVLRPTLILSQPELPQRYCAQPPPPARIDEHQGVAASPLAPVTDTGPRLTELPPVDTSALELLWHEPSWNDAAGARAALRREAGSLESLSPRPSDRGEAPVAVVQGRLRPSFCPRARLKSLLDLARPWARRDEGLATELATVEAVLESPIQAAPDVVSRLSGRVVQQWRRRFQSTGDLNEMVGQVLLVERAYVEVTVLGQRYLRAELDDGTETVVVYLLADLATRLPRFAELDVRLVVRVHPRQDAHDPSPIALGCLALSRRH